MRGTVAKRLRKEARRMSGQTEHKTKWHKKILKKTGEDGRPVVDYRGTVICTGYRRVYQDMKGNYKRIMAE